MDRREVIAVGATILTIPAAALAESSHTAHAKGGTATILPPNQIDRLSRSAASPALPTAMTMRPQFGSPPAIAVFTTGELAIERPIVRAALSRLLLSGPECASHWPRQEKHAHGPRRSQSLPVCTEDARRRADKGMRAASYDEKAFAEYFKGREIVVRVDVGVGGKGKATIWTCDLTHDYVSINADKRS